MRALRWLRRKWMALKASLLEVKLPYQPSCRPLVGYLGRLVGWSVCPKRAGSYISVPLSEHLFHFMLKYMQYIQFNFYFCNNWNYTCHDFNSNLSNFNSLSSTNLFWIRLYFFDSKYSSTRSSQEFVTCCSANFIERSNWQQQLIDVVNKRVGKLLLDIKKREISHHLLPN